MRLCFANRSKLRQRGMGLIALLLLIIAGLLSLAGVLWLGWETYQALRRLLEKYEQRIDDVQQGRDPDAATRPTQSFYQHPQKAGWSV